jgi:colanic acid/amylovoran biosynthesis glycosyltransferase
MKQKLKVAYLLHRFPDLTETFIMREMYWIREHDMELYIFSLLRPKREPLHEQTKELLPYTRYCPFLSWAVIKAQMYFLWRSPKRYLRALAKTVWQTYREPGVLLRVLILFPKSVYFAQQIEELGIEHIHAHFVWIEGIAAGIASDLLGITFTLNPHGFDLFERNQRNVRRELENASKIVTVSDYHCTYIAGLCPQIDPSDVEVVHYGLEIDRFRPSPRLPDSDPICILSVGRLIEKKGFEFLIEACALLVERGLTFQCRIVGAGPLREALQARIGQHRLRDRVILLGALDQAKILQLYQMNDIFALPCVVARSGDRDGMPVVLIEAMACGLPVVTTAVTGIPELVYHGETGLVVRERDAVSLADALERLITDTLLRKRLGQQARRMIAEGFQSQHNAAKLAAIFQQVSAPYRNSTVEGAVAQ